MRLKASASEGSPSSDGANSRTGGFSPGIPIFASGSLCGSTTFAIASVYRIGHPERSPFFSPARFVRGHLGVVRGELKPYALVNEKAHQARDSKSRFASSSASNARTRETVGNPLHENLPACHHPPDTRTAFEPARVFLGIPVHRASSLDLL